MTSRNRPVFLRGETWKGLAGVAGFLAGFLLAPLFGVIFILGGVAGVVSDSHRLHRDDDLRAVATVTTATIDDIDVRHFSSHRGSGHTECIPIVTGNAAGKQHTWELKNYPACGDFYTVGRQLQIMYDPNDIDRVGLADNRAPAVYQHNLGVDIQILVAGVAGVGIGASCWFWLTRKAKRKQ